MAEYLPKYAPGRAQTRPTSAAVTGGQLLYVSGSNTVAPTTGGTAAWCGVASNDAASGANVMFTSGGVQKIVTGTGGVTAGDTVHPATGGTVVTHTPGTNDLYVVGIAITTATAGNTAEIQMER